MFISTQIRYGIALVAGTLLPLSFAPLNFWPLAILAPSALLFALQDSIVTLKQAFLLGFCFGMGMFGVGTSWVFVSIHDFGGTNIVMALFMTTLFVLFLSLFPGFQALVLKRWFRGNLSSFCLLGFPSCWVIFEWIRSWLFTGFPWLYLGYSQLETPLSSYAPIASVYGVSTAVALSSGALLTVLQGTLKTKIIALIVIAGVWGGGYSLRSQTYTQVNPKAFTVSLIQSNIAPLDKFAQEDPVLSTEQTYGLLTQEQWGTDLILWPEGAIPLPIPIATPYVNQLREVAWMHQSTLITGIQEINESGNHYNSLIALGNGHGSYHKYHLVPFGDFVPLEFIFRKLGNFFNLPMSDFVSGPKEQALLKAGPLNINPLVCYEIAFPELVRSTLRNADVIINLSEDGWFGKSWGPLQHVQIAQMRALETGRFVLRATPSGVTAIIDPQGKIVTVAPQFEQTVLKGTFHSIQGNTPWDDTGIWPLLIILFATFILPGRGTIRFNQSLPKSGYEVQID